MSELLSYKHILNDIKKFKRAGSVYGDEFNIYDTPAHKYFKILFYFGSSPEIFTATETGSGLLAPTWELYNNSTKTNYYNHNSAWAYLKLNDENERAEKLEQFVTLLSDINTNSPWYFSTVGGVQEALERKITEDGKLEMNDNKKLTITCLPDAFDNRIGTLLELYRDVTWSWTHKKEVIPANLRKFDMAIYIFETPEVNWHEVKDTLLSQKDTIIGNDDVHQGILGMSAAFWPSYKMIEFHDCEFNYNSIKSAWNELNNQTGISPTYTIDISYADCYEISYNDIMMRTIGDVIMTDILNDSKNDNDYISVPQADISIMKNQLKSKTYPYDKGWLGNALEQVGGHLVSDVKDLVNQKLMGNIFGFSLTNAINQAKDLLQGDVIKTGMTIAQYAKQNKNKNKKPGKPTENIYIDSKNNTVMKPTGDIFPEPNINNQKPNGDIFPEPNVNNQKPNGDIFPEPNTRNQKPNGDIFPEPNTNKSKPIGNIFSKSTLANNL